MISEKVNHTIRNFIWTVYGSLISTIFPFIIRTLLIHYIGIEYSGVSNLFTSVLQVLNLADFGIDNAIVVYLYKPMAQGDREKTSAVLKFVRKLYRIVGLSIMLAGILLTPFVPLMISGKAYPTNINIYFVYLIYVLYSASSYLLGNYKAMLFKASQRTDIIYKIAGTALLLMYVAQIIVIYSLHSYYLFVLLLLFNSCLYAWWLNTAQKKYFPEFICSGSLDDNFKLDFKKKFFAIGLSKLRNVSRNSFDSIVISSFLGLRFLAIYQNYYQVMLVPLQIISIVHAAIAPSLGNGIAIDPVESNFYRSKKYVFVQSGISLICMSFLLNLLQPFMKLWVGEEYLLPYSYVIIFVCYFYLMSLCDIAVLLRETTGIWWEGRYIAVGEAAANLILNILMVKLMGMMGVIVATILTLICINIPFEFYYIFKNYFKGYLKRFVFEVISYSFEIFIILATTSYLINIITQKQTIGIGFNILISALVPFVLFMLLNFKRQEEIWLIHIVTMVIQEKVLMRKKG